MPTSSLDKTTLPVEVDATDFANLPYIDIENDYNKVLRGVKELWAAINGEDTGNDSNGTPLEDYTGIGVLDKIEDVTRGKMFAPSALVISSDAITVTRFYHIIDTEASASTDDLVTINGGADTRILALRTTSDSRDVVIKTSGNITTPTGSDFTLSGSHQVAYFIYNSTTAKWDMLFASGTLYGGINAQTGTTYTVSVEDRNKLITFTNASTIAVTLPQASTAGFSRDWKATFKNIGSTTVTITPTTSTIDGAASYALAANEAVEIYSDGTNYRSGIKNVAAASPYTSYTFTAQADMDWPVSTKPQRITFFAKPANDGVNAFFQFSNDNRASFLTANYEYSSTGRLDTGTASGGSSTSASGLLLNGDGATIGNATKEGIFGTFVVNPRGTTDDFQPGITGINTVVNGSTATAYSGMGGCYNSTLANMNGARIVMSAGNVTGWVIVEELG